MVTFFITTLVIELVSVLFFLYAAIKRQKKAKIIFSLITALCCTVLFAIHMVFGDRIGWGLLWAVNAMQYMFTFLRELESLDAYEREYQEAEEEFKSLLN